MNCICLRYNGSMHIGSMYTLEVITPKRFLVSFAVHSSTVHSTGNHCFAFCHPRLDYILYKWNHKWNHTDCTTMNTTRPQRISTLNIHWKDWCWSSSTLATWFVVASTVLWLCCSSVAQACLTVCDPMDCLTPGFPVFHCLLEFAQTLVHWISDIIQPSHLLSSPSPPDFNLSQHQDLFQPVGSLHQVARVLELQHQSFQWVFRVDIL